MHISHTVIFIWETILETILYEPNIFFQVKEYCPLVFRNLRERFDIDDASYLKSLTKSPKSMGPSAGKSGAKFYLSQDKLYVIKTLESVEVEQMHSLLKQYHPFIVERHGK